MISSRDASVAIVQRSLPVETDAVDRTSQPAGGLPEDSPIHCLPRGLSVVIPVYNSDQILPVLIARLEGVLKEVAEWFEVVLVNDGSRDQSWHTIVSLSRGFPWIRGIDLMRNRGQENALLCGVRAATYDTIITMDDDLQNPPEEIPTLLAKLREGHDVVYGVARAERHGLFRNGASLLTKLMLQRAMGAETARHLTAFKAFRTHLREAFAGFHSPCVSLDVLLTWGTERFSSVQVRQDPRYAGRSTYTLAKLAAHATTLMVGFGSAPLHMVTLFGAVLVVGGGASLTAWVLHRLLAGATSSNLILIGVLLLLAGLQLCAIGVLGEYLARVHARLLDRGSYDIRARTKTVEELVVSGSPAHRALTMPSVSEARK